MFDFFKKYHELPNSVKRGVILLIISWCWFFISMYYLFFNQTIPPELHRALLVGPMVCLAIFKLANWARILCLTCNAMAIVYFIGFAVFFFQTHIVLLMASLVNIALFGASSYFLAIKESSAFFKAYNKPVKDQAEDKTS